MIRKNFKKKAAFMQYNKGMSIAIDFKFFVKYVKCSMHNKFEGYADN